MAKPKLGCGPLAAAAPHDSMLAEPIVVRAPISRKRLDERASMYRLQCALSEEGSPLSRTWTCRSVGSPSQP